MRVIACICAAVFALLFVALVGLYVVLPRVAGEDAVRARLSEAASSVIGRGIEFTTLEFALLPPSVTAIGAVVGDTSMPLARAERVKLTPALAPLLAGMLLVDSVTVEAAEIHLVRTGSEIAFADSGFVSPNRAARVDLAVRGLSLSRTRITLEDRSIQPPVLWTLRDVAASASAESLGSPVRIEVDGEFAPEGRLIGAGELTANGELQLEFELEAVAISPARPYFTAGSEVAGWLSGSLRVNGNVDSPAIELTATLREAEFQLGEIALRGTLEVEASIRDLLGAPNGLVELDATRAELRYAGLFNKAPGIPARVVGQVTTGPGGVLAVDAWEFVMQDLDGRVQVGAHDQFHVADQRLESALSAFRGVPGRREDR